MDSNIVTAIIQGIVEGLTEFLPVSSTGHLILSGKLLEFSGEKADTFEIIIQLGAILAVAVIYYRRILALFGLAMSNAPITAATNFSFLVAIPMMLAASGYEMLKSYKLLTVPGDAAFFIIGFITAFVVALLAVLTFLKLLERFKLAPFAYYRFVLAAIFLVYLLAS